MKLRIAIKSGFQNYANFNGRSSRSAYWFWQLFVLVVANFSSAIFSTLGALFSLAVIVPSISVGWRRMHDTGRAGWWSIIPIVGFVFAIQQSDPDMNEYGPPNPPMGL
jgi:uncharacterized membrane protein YhaH (DUF805 family)